MKHQKNPVISTKELDAKEIEKLELEIKNRQEIIQTNNELLKTGDAIAAIDLERYQLHTQELQIKIRNPLKFQDTQEWSNHLKKCWQHETQRLTQEKNHYLQQLTQKRQPYLTQNQKCTEDIQTNTKRIQQLTSNNKPK